MKAGCRPKIPRCGTTMTPPLRPGVVIGGQSGHCGEAANHLACLPRRDASCSMQQGRLVRRNVRRSVLRIMTDSAPRVWDETEGSRAALTISFLTLVVRIANHFRTGASSGRERDEELAAGFLRHSWIRSASGPPACSRAGRRELRRRERRRCCDQVSPSAADSHWRAREGRDGVVRWWSLVLMAVAAGPPQQPVGSFHKLPAAPAVGRRPHRKRPFTTPCRQRPGQVLNIHHHPIHPPACIHFPLSSCIPHRNSIASTHQRTRQPHIKQQPTHCVAHLNTLFSPNTPTHPSTLGPDRRNTTSSSLLRPLSQRQGQRPIVCVGSQLLLGSCPPW